MTPYFFHFSFLVNLSMVVKPKEPKANNDIASTKFSEGVKAPLENVLANKAIINEIIHNNPLTLFDEMEFLSSINILFKNSTITIYF